MRRIQVDKPIFHISRPGDNTRYSTEGTSSQTAAIQAKRRSLFDENPGLPTELPEKKVIDDEMPLSMDERVKQLRRQMGIPEEED